jgi:CRP/FNR family transcriptional regulator, cyclic AMP receptor protein
VIRPGLAVYWNLDSLIQPLTEVRTMPELLSIVGAHPFLRRLPACQAEKMAALARHVSFPPDHRLFEEGTPARKLWLIDAGQVALDTLVPGQGRVTIERLGRGDLLGLSWFHAPYLWDYGSITTQPMQAFEFDAAEVRAACDADPVLGYAVVSRLLAVAVHRLQATRCRLVRKDCAAA